MASGDENAKLQNVSCPHTNPHSLGGGRLLLCVNSSGTSSTPQITAGCRIRCINAPALVQQNNAVVLRVKEAPAQRHPQHMASVGSALCLKQIGW